MKIYLRNCVVVECSDKLKSCKSDSEGHLVAFEWVHHAGVWLRYIDLREVICIVDDHPQDAGMQGEPR